MLRHTGIAPLHADTGFTMVEVLFAIILLAIGFLGLQALAVGSVRMVARADRQAELAMAASQEMEVAFQQMRAGQTPQSRCTAVGDVRISRRMEQLDTRTPRVTVTATAPAAPVATRPVTLQASLFTRYPLSGTDSGSGDC